MDFYESAYAERGYSLRLDLLIVYDLNHLEAVPEDDPKGYAFKYPDRKKDALLGIIHIL